MSGVNSLFRVRCNEEFRSEGLLQAPSVPLGAVLSSLPTVICGATAFRCWESAVSPALSSAYGPSRRRNRPGSQPIAGRSRLTAMPGPGNFGDRGSVGVLPARRCRQLRICRAINTFVLIGLDKDAAADQLNRHHRRDLDEVQSHETDCSTNIFRGSYREANQRCDAPSATICQQPQRKRIRS